MRTLKEKINSLVYELKNKNKTIEELQDEIKIKDLKINELEKKLMNSTSIIKIQEEMEKKADLMKEFQLKENKIKEKDLEILKLKNLLTLFGIGYNNKKKTQIVKEEKISVMITSQDGKDFSNLNCNINDSFIRVEERFYEKYPKYKKTDNFFLINDYKVNRFMTMKENKIVDDGIKITLIKPGEALYNYCLNK